MSTATITLLPTHSNTLTRNLRIFLTESRYEFTRLLRTRSFSLSVIGFPVVFYLFFGLIMNHGEHIGSVSVAKYMLASYSVFGMVGAALFGIGVGLSGEIAAGWLELKRASPMPPIAYLLAKCCSAVAFGIISSAEIATDLRLSEGTVRNYLSEAIAKLGAANRIDAARIARTRGWL